MAAKEEAEGHDAKEGESKPKKGKGKLIIIIVVVLALVGGGAAFMLGGGKAEEKKVEEEEVEKEKHYETAELETFVVNLGESASFIKVTMLVEYDPELLHAAHGGEAGGEGHGGGASGGGEEKKGGLPPAMEARKPMIRDAVIRVLSSKKAAEVLSKDGKEQLRQELVEAINEAIGMEEGPVVQVYFTDFIIQ